MTSRERILTTLKHQQPDRIPFDLSSTPVTGIHRIAYQRLRKALGLEERQPVIWHQMQQLAMVEEDVLKALEVDVVGLRPNAPSTWQLEIEDEGAYLYYTDEWGVVRRTPKDGGIYFDHCLSPLAAAESPQDIEDYPFPDSVDETRFVGLQEAAEKAHQKGVAFILGGISAGMLEMGQWLRGFDTFLMDLALNRPLAEALLDKITELKMLYWERVLAELPGLVDIVQEGDDYGMQNGLIVSPSLWRELFKPRLKRLISFIKSQAPVYLFFHVCGSIYDIIPDLIEVGVDILNPVQVSAARMDTKQLKKEFGDELTFWGGGCDTQWVLPQGTPQQVREEVKRRIDDLSPNGGFVFNTVHNIQADVPPENILAMWETLRQYGS